MVAVPQPVVSTHTIPSSQSVGEMEVHVFEPLNTNTRFRGTIVTVHPWAVLGGGEHNTRGIARHISCSPSFQWRVITFTLKSTPFWRGGMLGGIFSKHYFEVQQIVHVIQWAIQTYDSRIVILGSSAGAPMAGSAMAQILINQAQINEEEQHCSTTQAETKCPSKRSYPIAAYIAVGYTFGRFAALGFGQHFSSMAGNSLSLLSNICGNAATTQNPSAPPKLFIMGENDEFTSVEQLEQMLNKMKLSINPTDKVEVDIEIVPNVGHFELESSRYDRLVSDLILKWLNKILTD